VNSDGYREILGICEGAKEDKAGWSAFLKHLKERGLRGVQCVGKELGRALESSLAALCRALVPQYLQSRSLDQGAIFLLTGGWGAMD
jgi:transposase-like protein